MTTEERLAGLEQQMQDIRERGGKAMAFGGSSASAVDVAKAVAATRDVLGPISILVNNAALSPFCKFEDLTEDIWDDLMAINLKGPFLCYQAIIPDMVAAGWGRIINISSSSAQTGSARQTMRPPRPGSLASPSRSRWNTR